MGSAAVLSNELKNNIAQTCQGTSAWSGSALQELTAVYGGKLPTDKPSQTQSAQACVIQVTIVSLSPLWEWLICKPSEALLEPFQLWSPHDHNHDLGYVDTVAHRRQDMPSAACPSRARDAGLGRCVGCQGGCSAHHCNNTWSGLRPLWQHHVRSGGTSSNTWHLFLAHPFSSEW